MCLRHARRTASERPEGAARRLGASVALLLVVAPPYARAQEARPPALNDSVLAVLERAGRAEAAAAFAGPGVAAPTLLSPALAAARPAGEGRPAVTGQVSFAPIITTGTQPAWGVSAGPVDYTSNSRVSVDYGRTRLTLSLSRPTTFTRAGQPDRHYTAELARGRQVLRVGDITPRFTEHTTGYARVHGAEAQLALGRLAQFRAVHGLSQRAAGLDGLALGTFERTFTGARLTVTPWRPLAVSVTGVRMMDEPAGAFLPAPPLLGTRAGENLVLGADAAVSFLARRRGQLVVEYAASVYTDDLAAPDSAGRVRGEWLSPAGLARTGLVGSLVAVNDSTRVGHAVMARLALPTGGGRTTIEFRHSSPLYATLAQPWVQAGLTRYRLQSNLPLFDRAVLFTANGDYSRAGPGRVQPFSIGSLNAFATVSVERTPLGRLTVSMRGTRRENDAPAPEPQRPDRRMRATMLAPSVALTRDVRLGMPVALTLTAMGTAYSDAFRQTSAYRTLGMQVAGATPPDRPLTLQLQARYARTSRPTTGAVQNSGELMLREGYDVLRRRLHVFVVQGVAGDRTSDGWQHSNLFTIGAGARWAPSDATGLEVEWTSRRSVNYLYDAFSYGQQTVEMRLTHRW